MLKVLTQEGVQKFNLERKRPGIMKVYNNHGHDSIFSANGNNELRTMPDGRPVRCLIDPKNATSLEWKKSAAYVEHWEKIRYKINIVKDHFKTADNWKRNIEHMPPGTADLFDLMRIDITRRIMEMTDLTQFITTEITDDDFDDPTYAQWLYDYVAYFKHFSGQGEKVNQVFTRLGDKTPIEFELAGIGFEQDLYNQMFNKIFSMQKVNEAVARGYIRRKNNNVFAPIINFAYPANKIVAAVTAFSLDQNYYDTAMRAITTLGLLRDFQTKQEINVNSGLVLITHSTRVIGWTRALTGQLRNGSQVKNLNALTTYINKIIPYNTITERYFLEDITYQGCDREASFLLVPENFFYLIKRGLTHITGPGDTFAVSSNKETWYTCDAQFSDQFFGGDEDDPADEAAAGNTTTITQEHGYVVAIQNPPDLPDEST